MLVQRLKTNKARSAPISGSAIRRIVYLGLLPIVLSGCGFGDGGVAEQRAVVEEVFQSIEWPQGYEQWPELRRRDPNLDSLNRQPGTINILFDQGDNSLDDVRDDFDRALRNAEFLVRSGRCDGETLSVGYYSDEHVSIAPNVRAGNRPSNTVSVQLNWTVPSGEPAVRVPQPLPECP